MRRKFAWLGLVLLLGGCVETEARLVWAQDGSMNLFLSLVGEGVNSQGQVIISQLEGSDFREIRLEGDRIRAVMPIKPPGWDRITGFIPGRFDQQDPTTGLTFYRQSYVFYEDYGLEGKINPAQIAGLPEIVGFLNLPIRLVVETPWRPEATTGQVGPEGEVVWQGQVTDSFPISVRYRVFFYERIAGALVIVALLIYLFRRRR